MDANTILEIKDGDPTRPPSVEAPSLVEVEKPIVEGIVKKKRRRGKTKRKVLKPFLKLPWQDTRNDKNKRNNRFRKIVMAKSRAPFNNNQFLMEIHKPDPENNFHSMRTPSTARTRDSSFSVDSEDNYFFSLPEDEEEYLTKEFSSVYEDAQCERLSNMSKNELIQEFLLLEAKYENLVKRTERCKPKITDEERNIERDTSMTYKDSMLTDKDISGTSVESTSTVYDPNVSEMLQRLKDQEDQIRELKLDNEKLQLENDQLRQTQGSSSEDSESDSSSSSDSCSSSSCSMSPIRDVEPEIHDNNLPNNEVHTNGQNGETEDINTEYPLVNGFHSPEQ